MESFAGVLPSADLGSPRADLHDRLPKAPKKSIFTSHWTTLYYEGGDALAQPAQRSPGCPLPGSVQGQVGWGFEQPGLVDGVSALGTGVGTR